MRDLVYDDLEDATGLAYQTVKNCKWVSESVDLLLRSNSLSWSHHKLLAIEARIGELLTRL